jgi:MYXO-CTERM domain-containing protein
MGLRRFAWGVSYGAVGAGVLALAPPAHAADTSSLTSITLHPTLSSVGVDVAFEGDDDADGTLSLAFRKAGDAAWMPGHRILRIRSGLGRSSALFLQADTDYEVRVTLEDPDNAGPVEISKTTRTRPDTPAAGTGQHYWVDAALGAPGNDGSQSSPFPTIQAAADVVGAGDTVHVAAGTYRESVTIQDEHGGSSGNPVRFVADPGAILDGADPALEDGSAFALHEGTVYWAPFSGEGLYAAVNDDRLYDYATLEDLMTSAAGIDAGFYVDQNASRIYVRTPSGASPAGQSVHVATKPVGFLVDTVTDVVIEGFEIRYYGTAQYSGVGVDVRDASRVWVRNNHIHHVNDGVRVRRPNASENVIEGNEIRDTGVWTWPWEAVKAHTPEATAVSITGGSGNVVRHNRLSGTFNGVYVGAFGDSSEAIAHGTDVHDNQLGEHGDDGLEPEGACVHVRFWRNVMHGVHNGVSLAPIEVGPLFLVRNVIAGYGSHALKVNNGPTGWVLAYHNTSVPGADEGAQAFAPALPFAGLVTRNNIWTGHRYVIESSITPSGLVDLDYDNLTTDNLDGTPRFVKWLDVRYESLAELKASGTIEQHGFGVVPAYEDPATGDYTPVQGSGLLDVGEVIDGVNDRFIEGAGPDLGAFERGGEGPQVDGGMPDGSAGAGGSGGSGGVGGSGGSGGTSEPDGGTSGSGGSDGGATDLDASDYPGDPIEPGGCGCDVTGRRGGSVGAIMALLGLVAVGRRRRRG